MRQIISKQKYFKSHMKLWAGLGWIWNLLNSMDFDWDWVLPTGWVGFQICIIYDSIFFIFDILFFIISGFLFFIVYDALFFIFGILP